MPFGWIGGLIVKLYVNFFLLCSPCVQIKTSMSTRFLTRKGNSPSLDGCLHYSLTNGYKYLTESMPFVLRIAILWNKGGINLASFQPNQFMSILLVLKGKRGITIFGKPSSLTKLIFSFGFWNSMLFSQKKIWLGESGLGIPHATFALK